MSLWMWIKEIVQRMFSKKTIENVIHVTPAISDRMADNIELWSAMYEGFSPWLREPTEDNPVRIVSLGLPQLISSEKARMVCLEMKSEVSEPTDDTRSDQTSLSGQNKPILGASNSTKTNLNTNKSSTRAEYLNKYYKKLLKQIRRQVEYGIAKGGIVIKPYVVMYKDDETDSDSSNTKKYNASLDSAEIEFDFVQADRFFPLVFDANGKVIEAAFIQTKVDKAKERVYIRLEYHKLVNHKVIVRNYAFESMDMTLANTSNIRVASNLGNPIKLSDVPEWSTFSEEITIENVDRLLFAYFRMPDANTIDPYSPLGVSGYSRVVQLIRDADEQYSRLLWEFEGGEMAIDVDRDALKFITDPNGESHSVLPTKQQRLFRKVDLNSEDTYNVFAPGLRDNSILNGLNAILTRIEDVCGLSRGTLSEIRSEQIRTATELKILKQRSYATNADIQAALQDTLEDVVYVMDVYCTLYEVTPDGEYEMSFEWDDSILVDSESELSKRITLMQNGLASKLETRMWYFGETENQARAALQQIDVETQMAAEQKAEADVIVAKAMNKVNEEPDTTSPADTTKKKISTGEQADSLENPDKSKFVDQIKSEG